MFFQSKKLIGLDIGSANIKMVELELSRRAATLSSINIQPIPPRAITGGEISDAGAISEVLKSMILTSKTKRKAAAVGLWGTSIITKRISIPQMEEKLVPGQIRWEAEQYIPYDINEVNIDFKILKNYRSSPDNMDLILVAAKQDTAFLYQDIVQSAGIQCAVVDVTGFALANCFIHNWGVQKGQTVALMNIGAGITNFVVIESGEVIFCRDIPVGGMTYSMDIQKSLGTSIEEAESLKISACTGREAPDEVMKTIQSTHESIVEEIQSSVDFFLNTSPGLALNQCFVTGGASRTTGLTAQIAQQTKLKLEILDPLKNIKINERNYTREHISEIRDFSAVAIGLGLRTIGDA